MINYLFRYFFALNGQKKVEEKYDFRVPAGYV